MRFSPTRNAHFQKTGVSPRPETTFGRYFQNVDILDVFIFLQFVQSLGENLGAGGSVSGIFKMLILSMFFYFYNFGIFAKCDRESGN